MTAATITDLEALVAEKEAAYKAAAERLAPLRTVQAEQEYVNSHYAACLAVARSQGVLLNGPATFQAARESYRELVDMAREVYDEALKELTRARVALWHAA